MKPAGAIFDLDGTLLDSMPMWEHLGERYLRSLGLVPPAGLADVLREMTLREAACYCRSACGAPGTPAQIEAGFNRMMERFYRFEAPLRPGAVAFLAALEKAGIKMCVATAADPSLARAALERTGAARFFERILTCSEVGCGKSDPAIFEAARSFLGTPKERTLVFEDAPHAIRTARRAGFPVCATGAAPAPGSDARLANFYLPDFTLVQNAIL